MRFAFATVGDSFYSPLSGRASLLLISSKSALPSSRIRSILRVAAREAVTYLSSGWRKAVHRASCLREWIENGSCNAVVIAGFGRIGTTLKARETKWLEDRDPVIRR
jgi:hypothetical protein